MADVLNLDFQRMMRLIPGYDPWRDAEGCWFDEDAARMAVDFFPECLRHVEGRLANTAFNLEPWQKAMTGNIFGWKRRDSKGRVVRRYREALVYIPRKNGKTPWAAGIGIFVTICEDEFGQQNTIAAAALEQAGKLFRHAKGMVERCEELASRCQVFGGNAPGGQSKSLVRSSDGSFLRVISADADTKHGDNPHLVIVDELHAQPNAELYDTLHTGLASDNRVQPLFVCITTADYDRESICNERYDYACGVRDGTISDPTFLPVIYEATEGDDWTDPRIWAKANPNLGISVNEDYLRIECAKAIKNPRLQNSFKRLHLNVRTRSDVKWLAKDAWVACAGYPMELPLGVPIFGAFDLSSKKDLTAAAWAWRSNGKVMVKVRIWAPSDRIRYLANEQHDPSYRLWCDAGFLHETPGEVVDYGFIEQAIVADAAGRDVKRIGYDPWNATQTALNLANGHGFELVEFRQGYVSMNEPCKELERLLIGRTLVHENNPCLNWMADNVQVRNDPSGNIRPVKPAPKSRSKIDGIVAVVMAIGLLMRSPAGEASVYEEGGVPFSS